KYVHADREGKKLIRLATSTGRAHSPEYVGWSLFRGSRRIPVNAMGRLRRKCFRRRGGRAGPSLTHEMEHLVPSTQQISGKKQSSHRVESKSRDLAPSFLPCPRG